MINKEEYRDSTGLINWNKYCAALEKENESLKKQIGENKQNDKVQKVLKEYCQCIKECSKIDGTEYDACDGCSFEDNCYIGKSIISLFHTDEEIDEFVKQLTEKLECESGGKFEKAFSNACEHISIIEEPLCMVDECIDIYESCRQCEHSVCTVEEWKEYFMKGEF